MQSGYPTHTNDITGRCICLGDEVKYDYPDNIASFIVVFENNSFRKKYADLDESLPKPLLEYGEQAKRMRLKVVKFAKIEIPDEFHLIELSHNLMPVASPPTEFPPVGISYPILTLPSNQEIKGGYDPPAFVKAICNPKLLPIDISVLSDDCELGPKNTVDLTFEIRVVGNGNFSDYVTNGQIDTDKICRAILVGELKISGDKT